MTCMKRYFTNKMLSVEETGEPPDPKFWKPKVTDYVQMIRREVPPLPENADGGLYTGTPGIAYLFYRLVKSPVTAAQKKEYVSQGIEYLVTAERYVKQMAIQNPTDLYGFLLGKGGFHAICAALYTAAGSRQKGDEHLLEYINLSELCNPVHAVPFGGNELFVGRAGYILGAIWLQKELQRPVLPVEKINRICQYIVDEGRAYAVAKRSQSPLMYSYYKTEYIGAAHGISAILFTLMCCEDFLRSNPSAEQDVKLSVDYVLSLQTRNGNFPSATDEIGYQMKSDQDYELVHWCHGAPGVVYAMAKAYLRWKEDKYLQSCIRCGEVVWEKGLLKKGPGICHGVAGNAYVFLLLYRLTKDEKYIFRAKVFAEFMITSEFKRQARRPDSPFSLYEGLAGALCFLLDLLEPNQAAFPFMDVF